MCTRYGFLYRWSRRFYLGRRPQTAHLTPGYGYGASQSNSSLELETRPHDRGGVAQGQSQSAEGGADCDRYLASE